MVLNKSRLLGQGNSMEVLQVPLIQIEQDGKIMFPDDRIEEILVSDEGIWYVSEVLYHSKTKRWLKS